MEKKAGLEKFTEAWDVNIIGQASPESIKQQLCPNCLVKFEQYAKGESIDEELCPVCTGLIQRILGQSLL